MQKGCLRGPTRPGWERLPGHSWELGRLLHTCTRQSGNGGGRDGLQGTTCTAPHTITPHPTSLLLTSTPPPKLTNQTHPPTRPLPTTQPQVPNFLAQRWKGACDHAMNEGVDPVGPKLGTIRYSKNATDSSGKVQTCFSLRLDGGWGGWGVVCVCCVCGVWW